MIYKQNCACNGCCEGLAPIDATCFPTREKIKNRACIEVLTCGKKHLFESNEVEAEKVDLIIIKEENCNVVFSGDTLCYKVKIFNNSNVSLCDVEFKDSLPTGVIYEQGSLQINGKKEKAVLCGRTLCCTIKELKARCQTEITFATKVL